MNRKRSKSKVERTLPMMHPNAAAIDVGATMHMAAVRADRTTEPARSFGTFTTDLHRLVDWFTECGVETVVMESTSVYWILIFELLDARGLAVFLVNTRDCESARGPDADRHAKLPIHPSTRPRSASRRPSAVRLPSARRGTGPAAIHSSYSLPDRGRSQGPLDQPT